MKDEIDRHESFEYWSLTAPGIHGESVPMRDLSREEVDFCIVGAGAGGGVLGAKLAEAGFSVVIIDAGPHWTR
jgi:NADPH-dependent 2,4-dienoyl-CoA reductase/sulfur reductase-like enzyme